GQLDARGRSFARQRRTRTGEQRTGGQKFQKLPTARSLIERHDTPPVRRMPGEDSLKTGCRAIWSKRKAAPIVIGATDYTRVRELLLRRGSRRGRRAHRTGRRVRTGRCRTRFLVNLERRGLLQ